MRWFRVGTSGTLLAVLALFAFDHPGLASPRLSSGPRVVSFTRAVVNLENFSGWLQRDPPPSIRRALADKGAVWFGEIYRQLPTDLPTSREHNVPFAVLLERGHVVRAWSDANMNGDLTDDPVPSLSVYPGERAARSFLTTLRWTVKAGTQPLPIERLVRVVVEAPDSSGTPAYKTQDVYGMLGTLEVEGVARRALLYDANRDGLYTRGRSDGVFVDLEGDRHFTIDPMAPDFGPFAIPFSLLHTSFAADSVAQDGSAITWRELGPAHPAPAPEVGRPAPDFTVMDMQGRLRRLSALRGKSAILYFWASWCSSCRRQAEELRSLYDRSDRSLWDVLGICYDTERSAALRFRSEHGIAWPSSFGGGLPIEDPVGRLYRESGVGVFYVISPDGVLVDKVFEVGDLEAALLKLGPESSSQSFTTGR